jgi:hypothetical protein
LDAGQVWQVDDAAIQMAEIQFRLGLGNLVHFIH